MERAGTAEQTESVLRLVVDSLGDAVMGAYLHGSAVLGGLHPSSDLDVLVVLRHTMTAAERRGVVEGLLDVSGRRARRRPGRPVELTTVVQSDDDLPSDTRNVVLTLARIWTTLGTGTIKAKHDAAAWAIVRLPEEHRAVLAHASAVYLGHEDERWDDLRPRIRPHCDHVVAEIARLSP